MLFVKRESRYSPPCCPNFRRKGPWKPPSWKLPSSAENFLFVLSKQHFPFVLVYMYIIYTDTITLLALYFKTQCSVFNCNGNHYFFFNHKLILAIMMSFTWLANSPEGVSVSSLCRSHNIAFIYQLLMANRALASSLCFGPEEASFSLTLHSSRRHTCLSLKGRVSIRSSEWPRTLNFPYSPPQVLAL